MSVHINREAFVNAFWQQQSENSRWLDREEISELYTQLAGSDDYISKDEISLFKQGQDGVTLERRPDQKHIVEQKIYFEPIVGTTLLAAFEQLQMPLTVQETSENTVENSEFEVELAENVHDETSLTPAEQAQKLYEQAFDIVISSGTLTNPLALFYANQAVELDPSNIDALMLQYKLGGSDNSNLSDEEQYSYTLAVNSFVQGNHLSSLMQLQPLLEKSHLHMQPAVLDLLQRLETKVGPLEEFCRRHDMPESVITWLND